MHIRERVLEGVVLLAGAAVMVVELAGTRILAPHLGTSIFIWTSLIGVILASLSIGYFVGGRFADKRPTISGLAEVILASAWFVAVIPILKDPVLSAVARLNDIRIAAVVSSVFLFAIPSVFLAAVSPYAVRLAIRDVGHSGRVAGRFSALSAIGSIAGTFCAGFFLLSVLGNTRTIIWVAVILAACAWLISSKKLRVICGVSIIIFLFQLAVVSKLDVLKRAHGLIEVDTKYGWFAIFNSVDPESGKQIRVLSSGAQEEQSAMFLDGSNDLALEYGKYYRLGEHFVPNLQRALMIGGGAYSFPKDFVRRHPDIPFDVVEIDDMLTRLAQEYFDLQHSPSLHIYHEDGRKFLSSARDQYGVIYIDAFHNSYAIPHHLTTIEMVKSVFDHLTDDGAVLVNIIGSESGRGSRFLYSEYATYREVFGSAYLLKVDPSIPGDQLQNIMLVAVKSRQPPVWISKNPEFAKYLSHRFDLKIPENAQILVDDVDTTYQYFN